MTARRCRRLAISAVVLALALLLAQLAGLPLPLFLERVGAGLVVGWGVGVPLLMRLTPAEPSLAKLFVLGGVLSPTLAALGYTAALAAGLDAGPGPGLRALTVVYALALAAGLAALVAGRRIDRDAGSRAEAPGRDASGPRGPRGIGRALGATLAMALAATAATTWLLLVRPVTWTSAAAAGASFCARAGALLPGGFERLAVVESLRRSVPPQSPFVAAASWDRPFSSEALIALVGDALRISDGAALSLLAVLVCGLLPLLVYFLAAPAWQNGPRLVLGVALCLVLWLSQLATWSSGNAWPASWAGMLVLAGGLSAAHSIRHGSAPWPLLVGLFHGLAVLVEPWVGLTGAGAVAVAALFWRATPEAAPRTLLALACGVLPAVLGLRAADLWHTASFAVGELDPTGVRAAWPLPGWLLAWLLDGWTRAGTASHAAGRDLSWAIALGVLALSALLGVLALRATRREEAAAWPGRRAVLALLALEALAFGSAWALTSAAQLSVQRLLGALPLLLLAAAGPWALFGGSRSGAARRLAGLGLGALLLVLVAGPARQPETGEGPWAEAGSSASADLGAALEWLHRERIHFDQELVLAWNPDALPPFTGVACSGLAALSGLGLWATPDPRFDDADRAGPRCAGLRKIYSTRDAFDAALFDELGRLDLGLVLVVTARDRRDFPWLLNKLRPRGFGVLRVEGAVSLFVWPSRLAEQHPNAERRFPEEHVGPGAPAVYGEPR